jgi:hypothetical protein
MFETIDAAENPAVLEQAAADQQARLESALALVRSRASRSSAVIRRLLASAKVEGRLPEQPLKASCVTFTAAPFRGGLHLIYPWPFVAELTRAELASNISAVLRDNLRRQGEA